MLIAHACSTMESTAMTFFSLHRWSFVFRIAYECLNVLNGQTPLLIISVGWFLGCEDETGRIFFFYYLKNVVMLVTFSCYGVHSLTPQTSRSISPLHWAPKSFFFFLTREVQNLWPKGQGKAFVALRHRNPAAIHTCCIQIGSELEGKKSVFHTALIWTLSARHNISSLLFGGKEKNYEMHAATKALWLWKSCLRRAVMGDEMWPHTDAHGTGDRP